MKTINKQPKIRFKGYTDEWEQRKLGEVASFYKGKGYAKKDLVDVGHPILLYGNLYTNYKTVIEKVDTFAKLKEKSVLSNGNEVVVPSSGESAEDIARASAINKNGIILGGDLNIIRPIKELQIVFLALNLSNGLSKKELIKSAQGNSVVHLYNSDLKSVHINYPSIKEQTKIGNFFKNIDSIIALHQHKLEALEKTKKSFLQKMFPKKDETKPEIRFAGYTDDWEQRKLGEVAHLSSSKRIRLSDYAPIGVPFYRGSEISTGGIVTAHELFITEEKYNEIKEKFGVPLEGDLLITAVGTLGNIWKVDDRKFYYKDGNLIQLSNLSIESDYLIRYFKSSTGKRRLLGSAAGSNQKALTMVKMKDLIIDLPNKDEQQKIGTFFKQLDDNIALHQRQLEVLKNMKTSFLQKMYI
ncbi:restriction endonuclease subunit S [Vagococcus lutrae]|uniref:restriction endonuclease subunit S n=1 Tax=Vagococcus lutrae TaxID=81947 RepID=UPI002097E754|nr:restriction endonuclease subunit S [Vagococcus lutrae]MCO7151168.1 restriction endonuclease subunit S [Vagococcus lutrae]MDT2811352.1 restriction endonuclease subunit S [Vagococcus lutrae]MDT2819916.1 restriction endonuclease subunit S [Vagococcus lutrae]MDT2844820.1 restriction endonuclease subunit S [Vagococcus lutrae]WCG04966.1 restriction endonuclease subunit S [Vagococcus lutrae]